jgi:hypothetical protein
MKKKIKRFQDGGVADENFTAAQLEFLGGADRTDPYILARMRKAAPDAPKETVTKRESFDTSEGQNKNISDETRARAMKSVSTDDTPVAKPKKMAPKTTPAKVEVSKEVVVEKTKEQPKEEPKKTTKSTVPADFGKVSLPKSFSESGGSTEPKKSTARLSPVNLSLPDPLSRFKKSKGDKDPAYKDAGYKKGGVVKSSSASKRADGCAIRGKTRA